MLVFVQLVSLVCAEERYWLSTWISYHSKSLAWRLATSLVISVPSLKNLDSELVLEVKAHS